jgi:hypothetical protein
MTRLIGGKLGALYDEEAQSCASQINDLLEPRIRENRSSCDLRRRPSSLRIEEASQVDPTRLFSAVKKSPCQANSITRRKLCNGGALSLALSLSLSLSLSLRAKLIDKEPQC